MVTSADETGYRYIYLTTSYRCLLPPGYRELVTDSFPYSKLYTVIRHPRDESIEEWAVTHRYALGRLHHQERALGTRVVERRGCVCLIIFGHRVKLFYYVYQMEQPPTVTPASDNLYSAQIAASVTDPDPATRFTQLTAGTEPLDMRDADAKATVTRWSKDANSQERYTTRSLTRMCKLSGCPRRRMRVLELTRRVIQSLWTMLPLRTPTSQAMREMTLMLLKTRGWTGRLTIKYSNVVRLRYSPGYVRLKLTGQMCRV